MSSGQGTRPLNITSYYETAPQSGLWPLVIASGCSAGWLAVAAHGVYDAVLSGTTAATMPCYRSPPCGATSLVPVVQATVRRGVRPYEAGRTPLRRDNTCLCGRCENTCLCGRCDNTCLCAYLVFCGRASSRKAECGTIHVYPHLRGFALFRANSTHARAILPIERRCKPT